MKKVVASQKQLLPVSSRTVFGKKLKKLRYTGVIPANIFGPDFKSKSVTVAFKDFVHTYKIAKETGVVYLAYEKNEIPVLIKTVQHHPVNNSIVHIDFRKIDLKKKIQTEVPVVTIGTSEAVSQKSGVLLTQTSQLLIEALPEEIPSQIEVDISSLKELGTEIKVSDLPKSTKFEIKTPAEKVVVSVVAHKEESITPETTATAPEVITEVKPAEGEAGAPVVADADAKKSENPPIKADVGKKEEKK